MNKNIRLASQAIVGIFCLIGLAGENLSAAQDANPILRVGIIQRFGANPQDRIIIKAVNNDKLKLSFASGDGKGRQNLTADQVTLEVSAQPLDSQQVEEKVVLSNHRSFENATASAHRWQAKGIETEIAQPRRWQVWAKRSTYNTSLLRHLLLYSLRGEGYNLAQIETKTRRDRPVVSWVVGNFRYNRETLYISSDRGLFEVNQRLYGGSLRIQPNAYQNYTLVNQVPLETYLRGVVPHEIGFNAPYAAVQAQAVLARTYALASRHRFAVDNYEICADTQCQVYRGLEETSELADKAIDDTKSKVLTFNNQVVDALYSSTTGGITADYNDLWDGQERPYLKSKVDSVNNSFDPRQFSLANENSFRTFISKRDGFNEVGWDAFRWKADSSLDEIKGTLREFMRLSGDMETRFNEIKQVNIVERAASGRVLKMEVQTDTKNITLEKDEIIDAFYAPNSTLFYIQPLYEESKNPNPNSKSSNLKKTLKGYSFIGGGLGHGVGMSQTGSYHLGKLGWSYDRILDFYFSGTKLQTLKPEFISEAKPDKLPILASTPVSTEQLAVSVNRN